MINDSACYKFTKPVRKKQHFDGALAKNTTIVDENESKYPHKSLSLLDFYEVVSFCAKQYFYCHLNTAVTFQRTRLFKQLRGSLKSDVK